MRAAMSGTLDSVTWQWELCAPRQGDGVGQQSGSPADISWRSSEMSATDLFDTTGVVCGSSADVMRILVCGACG